ncbi:MAG: phosphoenolpyruvate carboxylase, partial [Caldilineaceae bacterium]|nr:phosphoenolpyruvate carboxylase [Caldilineaceae bacterium]
MVTRPRQGQIDTDVDPEKGKASARSDADRQLRGTVRQLGNVLGETIVEQEGQAIFDLVEELRALTRAQRQGDRDAGPQIEQLTADLVNDLDSTLGVLKAFT